MNLARHARFLYQPVRPLGKNRTFVTCSKAHWNLAYSAAVEGTVLLKNDGILPLKKGTKVCLFGLGAGEFLLGGGGSGEVFADREITLADALQAAADRGEIQFYPHTVPYYVNEVTKILDEAHRTHPVGYLSWRRGYQMPMPVLPEDIYAGAKDFGGVAVFCISRFSSEGDDNGDRTGGKGDFYLWDEEKALFDRLCKDFEKVVVVISTCGPISTMEYKEEPKVGAILYPLYGGGMAGTALVDILLGKENPSGHLQHTLAKEITDYPSTEGFHKNKDYVNYTEDIFVGYRYFETMAPEKVAYPFGFGLSYTTFSVEAAAATLEKYTIKVEAVVKNTGKAPGKEVVQLYLTAPQGKLGKAKKVLCAFGKTRLLQPGEEAKLKLHFDIREFGSFDDLGKVENCAFLLEQGEYTVHIGTNVRDTRQVLSFKLEDNIIVRRCKPYMAPRALSQRLTADGTMEKLPQAAPYPHPPKRYRLKAKADKPFPLVTALEENRLDEFISTLTDSELCEMLYGHPMTNVSLTNGIGMTPKYTSRDVKKIPLVPTADGPMGVRARPGRGVYTTFFPCATTMAQTWNLPLVKKMGAACAAEAKENNIGVWLAPGMNIHRNPLCGRNFEYYSEDPLSTGLMAAACVSGVQSMHIAATIKHFCCNNRENDRRVVDSRVSQRALREIYLRGFEIAVKKAKPWALMTSYNPVNGVLSNANWEAVNGILREEWGFDGVVMTDWWVLSTLEEEIHAGVDVKMPEEVNTGYENPVRPCDPFALLQTGKLDRGAVLNSVRRILQLMGKLD